jgi:serine/threonine-protein kinase RsbW
MAKGLRSTGLDAVVPDATTRERCNSGAGIITTMRRLVTRNRLMLRNDLAELKRLAGWIEGWAGQDLPSNISFALQLCLEEAVANIIMHGGAKDQRLEIAVELERNGGTLVARIEDNGRPFDPTRVPSPALASSLEEAKASDLGIHLMRTFASSIQYKRRNGCNQLTLQFVASQARSRPG